MFTLCYGKRTEALVDLAAIDFLCDLVSQADEVFPVNLWVSITNLKRKLLKLSNFDLRFEDTDDVLKVTHVCFLLHKLVDIISVRLAL